MSKTPHIYRCHSCKAHNRAEENSWCLCTGSNRSLVCSSCSACFCHAAAQWQREFWWNAPAWLHEQRRHEQRRAPVLSRIDQKMVMPIVLVIDDDRTVHAIASRVLASVVGTILHADDGETGLQLATEFQPDLVLADALLPKIDGREIARTLKSSAGTRHIKVVVLSGLYKGLRYRTEAVRDFLVDEYVEKPVNADKLLDIVTRHTGSMTNQMAGAAR
jgi:CheY-like chemotaxis protein